MKRTGFAKRQIERHCIGSSEGGVREWLLEALSLEQPSRRIHSQLVAEVTAASIAHARRGAEARVESKGQTQGAGVFVIGGAATATSDMYCKSLWDVALEADASAIHLQYGGPFWQAVMDGWLHLDSESVGQRRGHVLARRTLGLTTAVGLLNRTETAVLVRTLWGEQQKSLAAELGIACSTASHWYSAALAKLRLSRGPIPFPLVIAAQAWASGQTPAVAIRFAEFQYAGEQFALLSVRGPRVEDSSLTRAEEDVVSRLIEGESRWEIAVRRATSTQTVACQIRGIFSKLRVTGRYALIRHGVERGWFR